MNRRPPADNGRRPQLSNEQPTDLISLEPNVSCIHLGRVLSALASSSAVSSRPVASAENVELRDYEG